LFLVFIKPFPATEKQSAKSGIMVKVAENKVIDLDLFPGNKEGDKLAQQTRDAIQGKLPPEEAQGALANAQGALGAVGGTLGGGLKGVVDTAGNTVGSLAQGLQGTVQGVGDGLGSTVQFAGGAVGAGTAQLGNMFTGGNKVKSDETEVSQTKDATENRKTSQETKQSGNSAAKKGHEQAHDDIDPASERGRKTEDAQLETKSSDDKAEGVFSSSS